MSLKPESSNFVGLGTNRMWLLRNLFSGKLRQSLLISGADGLIIVLQFATSVLVARALLPSGRGELATILLWPTFFFTFIASGLRFSLMYHVGAYPRQRPDIIKITAYIGLVLSLISAVLNYFLLDLVLSNSTIETIALTKLLGCFMPVLFFAGFLPSILQGQQRYHLWNLVRIADPLIYLVLVAFLFSNNQVNLFNVTSAFVVTKFVITAILFTNISFRGASRRFNWRLARSIFGYLLKCLPTGWMGQTNNQLDQMLLSSFFPPQYLGWYRISVSTANLLRVMPMGLQRMVLPDVANESSPSRRVSYVYDSLKKSVTLTLIAFVPALILIGPVIVHAYGNSFDNSIIPAQILLFGVILVSLNGILVNAFRGFGRPMTSLVAEGIGVVVTVVGLIVLLPLMGLKGAAITTVLSYAATFALLLLAFQKHTKILIR